MIRALRTWISCGGVVFMLVSAASRARASDPVGIYGTITAVDYEPAGDWKAAQRVRIRGVFCLAKGRRDYEKPVQGYLYCSLVEGEETTCRREWRDLEKSAGSEKILAFASRYKLEKTRVRELGLRPDEPTPFSLSFSGIRELRRDSRYAPILHLNTFARPLAPLAEVAPGELRLEAARIHPGEHGEAKYVFWIAGPEGKKQSSPPIAPGEKKVVWKAPVQVRAGARYRWGVQAVDGEWKGPEAKAGFRGKGPSPREKDKAAGASAAKKAGEDPRS